MIDLFAEQVSDDLPEFLNVEYRQVEANWEDWLIWRSIGRRNAHGGFEPSISYVEAIQAIPSERLQVFLELDSLYSKMEKQYLKQTAGRKDM